MSICVDSSVSSSTTAGSRPSLSCRQRPALRSVARSISAWICSSVLMTRITTARGHLFQVRKYRTSTSAPSTPAPIATASSTVSVVAQLLEPVLVDAEVVRQLVQDGDADLLAQLVRVVPELVLERQPVDGDLVRQLAAVPRSALGQRHSVVEAEEVRILRVLVL